MGDGEVMLLSPDDVLSIVGETLAAARQPALKMAIAAAISWVEREGGRRSLEKESAPKTIILDGNRAEGYGRTDLWLPADVRPVWHTGGDLLTIMEYGAPLDVETTYNSALVQLRGVNEDRRVSLYRLGGWYPGRSNVSVTCKCGYDATPPDPDTGALPALLPFPAAIRQLIAEVAWLMLKSGTRIGQANVSKAGAAITFVNDLSPLSTDTLENMRMG